MAKKKRKMKKKRKSKMVTEKKHKPKMPLDALEKIGKWLEQEGGEMVMRIAFLPRRHGKQRAVMMIEERRLPKDYR